MSDYFKGFFGVILSLILMVAAPITLFKIRIDTVNTFEAMAFTAQFSEEVRQEGVITFRELSVLSRELSILGFGLDILLEEKVTEGHVENGLFIKTGEGYYTHTFKDIEESMIKGSGEYDLKVGDRVTVSINGRHKTLRYGGLVLNEAA